MYIYAYTLHQFYSFIHRQNLRWLTYLGYMSDTAVKMEVQISHEDSVFLSFGYISKSSGHIVVIFLSFWGTSVLFPIVTALSCFLTNSAQRFPFLHILSNTCYCLSFFKFIFNWKIIAVYCHPADLTYMQSTSQEMLGWRKHKWNQDCWDKYQSPLICRWHHSYGRKQRRIKELLDESERGEWKKLA